MISEINLQNRGQTLLALLREFDADFVSGLSGQPDQPEMQNSEPL